MSFGKRGQGKPLQQVHTARSPERKPERAGQPRGTGSLLRASAGFVSALALMTAVYFTYTSLMYAAGRKLTKQWDAQIAVTQGAPIDLALLQTPYADEWTFGQCTLRSPPNAMTASVPGKFEGRDGLYGGRLDFMGGDESIRKIYEADFLDCVSRTEAMKLCESSIRSEFAKDVSRFYAERKILVRERASPRDSFSQGLAVDIPEFSQASQHVENEMNDAKETVDSALKSAAAAGLIASSDFGFFAQSEIAEALKGVESRATPCS